MGTVDPSGNPGNLSEKAPSKFDDFRQQAPVSAREQQGAQRGKSTSREFGYNEGQYASEVFWVRIKGAFPIISAYQTSCMLSKVIN